MDRADTLAQFLETLPYNPYPFQEEALLAWFETDAGVMVCAPTGMGKTLIAEAAVFEALHTKRRIYYTTPLIALTDQKFREMQDLAEKWGFKRDDVGLITGNRRENPDATVRVVVAEILLNHLISNDATLGDFENVSGVVMDEFHSFNDYERGVVWELTLVLLPKHIRVLLLSATVGNPFEFGDWLAKEHGRKLTIVTSVERRVPLDFVWVGGKLLTEQLASMVSTDDAENRTPALVFCFNRDECWEIAEQLKGLPLVTNAVKKEIELILAERDADLKEGIGPKLRQMLLRGVGVHHAGVLPKHKHLVEQLFQKKLTPFVICTETLAAGINLPARSVVLTTLMKGKRGEKKLVPPATAHQMFGRAGRPQFDTRGYVFAMAHEDDVKIAKWKEKYDKIDPYSKDPGLMRMRKDLERKRPSRRKTEQYWVEGHFNQLIAAGPAKLYSRSMIPYSVLIYLLTRTGTLAEVRHFLSKRFTAADRIEGFQQQLNFMTENLAALGYLTKAEDGEHVTLDPSIYTLLNFRSIDPLFGAFLCEMLARGDFTEKILGLEGALEIPAVIERHVPIPDLPPGPLRTQVLEPMLIAIGATSATGEAAEGDEGDEDDFYEDEEGAERPPTLPDMLKRAFEHRLKAPEDTFVQPKWIAGAAIEYGCEFYKLVKAANLSKQEGIILRHLLRLVILAGEFFTRTEDPDYQRLSELAADTCRRVDPKYTERFLADAATPG